MIFFSVLLQPEDKPLSQIKLTARKPGLFSISTRHHIPQVRFQSSTAGSNKRRPNFRNPGPNTWQMTFNIKRPRLLFSKTIRYFFCYIVNQSTRRIITLIKAFIRLRRTLASKFVSVEIYWELNFFGYPHPWGWYLRGYCYALHYWQCAFSVHNLIISFEA